MITCQNYDANVNVKFRYFGYSNFKDGTTRSNVPLLTVLEVQTRQLYLKGQLLNGG